MTQSGDRPEDQLPGPNEGEQNPTVERTWILVALLGWVVVFEALNFVFAPNWQTGLYSMCAEFGGNALAVLLLYLVWIVRIEARTFMQWQRDREEK